MKILVVQTPHYDFCSASLIEGLEELERRNIIDKLMCSERSNYANIPGKHNYHCDNDDELIKFGKEADLIIMTSNQGVKEHIIDEINRREVTVYIDGEDTSPYRKEPHNFPLYFKREMLLSEEHPDNIRPFPFAAENRYFAYGKMNMKPDDKKINVACMFGPHDDMKHWRVGIENALKEAKIPESIIGQLYGGGSATTIDTGSRDHADYFSVLSMSKISVDAYGAYGCNAARFWESIANKCMLLTQPVLIHMPYPFEKGFHYIELEEETVAQNIDTLLTSNSWLAIASYAYEHLKKYHTTKARAQYLLDECKKERVVD